MSQPRHLNQPRPPIEPVEDDAQPQSAYEALPPRRRLFVDHYLLTCHESARAAYKLAYQCSEATAQGNATALLRDHRVQQAIAEQKAVLRARAGTSVTKILQERARLAFANMQDFHGPDGRVRPVHELSVDDSAAIAEWTETVKYGDGDTPQLSRKLKLHPKEHSLQFFERLFALDARHSTGQQPVSIEIHFSGTAPPAEPPHPRPPGTTSLTVEIDDVP